MDENEPLLREVISVYIQASRVVVNQNKTIQFLKVFWGVTFLCRLSTSELNIFLSHRIIDSFFADIKFMVFI